MRSALQILICLFLFVVPSTTYGQRPAGGQDTSVREKVLLKKDIGSYTGSDTVLTVRELVFSPSARGQKHRHPGPVVVCILEGSLEVALEGHEPEVYSPGQCFTEEPHQLHIYSRNPSQTAPVRAISYILSRKGEPLSRPDN
jgi:quercetin dioxygenase-like cupin family protein